MQDNIEHYLQLWNLDIVDPDWTRHTHSSTLLKVHHPQYGLSILKCLNASGQRDEADGARLLDWYNGNGAIRPYLWEPSAHLLEYAGERELKMDIVADHANDGNATDVFLRVVEALHRPQEAAHPVFGGLRRRFRELYRKAEVEGPDSLFGYAARLADHLLETTQEHDVLPLHGDLHHENILCSERGWLAIDPKGLTGDRHYDVANLFCNPDDQNDLVLSKARIQQLADKVTSRLDMDRGRALGFALVHAVLSATWSLLEGNLPNAELRLGVASLLQEEYTSELHMKEDRMLQKVGS